MSFLDQPAARESSIPYINDNYLADEQALVRQLAEEADSGKSARRKITETATQLVNAVRKNTKNDSGIEAFLQQYDLSLLLHGFILCWHYSSPQREPLESRRLA